MLADDRVFGNAPQVSALWLGMLEVVSHHLHHRETQRVAEQEMTAAELGMKANTMNMASFGRMRPRSSLIH